MEVSNDRGPQGAPLWVPGNPELPEVMQQVYGEVTQPVYGEEKPSVCNEERPSSARAVKP